MQSLAPVPRRLARDLAHEALLGALLDGRLEPGSVVRDVDLAGMLGMSRTPVREAMARLVDEGLLESKPNAYTRVTPLRRRDCEEGLAVLRALHVLAAREAAGRMPADRLREMRAANKRFAAALRAGDVAAALAADDDVHAGYLETAGNTTLTQMLERLHPRIRRLERLRFGSGPGRASVQVHDRIADALQAGDAEAAAELVGLNWDSLQQLIDDAFPDDASPDDPGVTDGAE